MKRFFRMFFTFISLLVLITSCEKDESDYRNKYVGIWKFHVEKSSFNMGDSSSYNDTIIYQGKLEHGEFENEIFIKYTDTDSLIFEIDKNGMFSELPTHYCSGEFIRLDSVHLFLRWGGLGGAMTHIVNGIKE